MGVSSIVVFRYMSLLSSAYSARIISSDANKDSQRPSKAANDNHGNVASSEPWKT